MLCPGVLPRDLCRAGRWEESRKAPRVGVKVEDPGLAVGGAEGKVLGHWGG